MMFVAKTIQQLEDAINHNAEEVVIVGKQASAILEGISRAVAGEDRNPLYPFFSRLHDGFEMLTITDNGQEMEGFLRLKNNLR